MLSVFVQLDAELEAQSVKILGYGRYPHVAVAFEDLVDGGPADPETSSEVRLVNSGGSQSSMKATQYLMSYASIGQVAGPVR
nr:MULTISPECIES: hypothetical protein [Frankia]